MNLNIGVWYIQWYMWSLGVLDRFYHYGDGDRVSDVKRAGAVNLCSLVRTIAIWTPLALSVQLLAYGGVLFALVGWPILLWGSDGYVGFFKWIAMNIVPIVIYFCVGALLGYLFIRLMGRYIFKPAKVYVVQRYEVRKAKRVEPKAPSFFQMMKVYYTSWKEKHCVMIRIIPKEETK